MTDFKQTQSLFQMPEGVIYLDGNSLGPLPTAVADRVQRMIREQWGKELIRGWNSAGWMVQPRQIGDRVGRLIGAPEGTVVIGDTLSIKVYQALAAAIELNPARRVILSDNGNFPSDLYMAEGLLEIDRPRLHAQGRRPRRSRRCDRRDGCGTDADRGRLPHRPAARHGGADQEGTCGRRIDGVGSRAFRGRHPDRRFECEGRFRRRLHLQISQWRSGRAGLHLCRAKAC